jgi:hypothetical protein
MICQALFNATYHVLGLLTVILWAANFEIIIGVIVKTKPILSITNLTKEEYFSYVDEEMPNR